MADATAEGRHKLLSNLSGASAAYVPRTGWPAWAVIPAAVMIFVLASVLGFVVCWGYVAATGIESGILAPEGPNTHILAVWLAGLQIGLVLITLAASRLFNSKPREVLALNMPQGGWAVLPLAFAVMFAGIAVWTAVMVWLVPEAVLGDLRPFQELLHGDGWLIVFLVIGIGAPLSEEFLFRGFLFSGLAKSRLGLIGSSLITAGLWTALHAGYSIYGLAEVFAIGLYFSWLLARTGSLWVTIFCHAVYNTIIAVLLYFITLPAPA
jgi:membrane protease YdiL (CAAX protease family)